MKIVKRLISFTLLAICLILLCHFGLIAIIRWLITGYDPNKLAEWYIINVLDKIPFLEEQDN